MWVLERGVHHAPRVTPARTNSPVPHEERTLATWSAKLAIGVPEIDAQHQELFERADALLSAMRSGQSGAEVDRLFWFLDDYCSSHFSAEEKFMRAVKYPAADAHADLHQTFTSEFEEIAARFRRGGVSEALTLELQQLIAGWLVMHIRATDTKLAEFVRTAEGPMPAFSPGDVRAG